MGITGPSIRSIDATGVVQVTDDGAGGFLPVPGGWRRLIIAPVTKPKSPRSLAKSTFRSAPTPLGDSASRKGHRVSFSDSEVTGVGSAES